MHVLCAAVYKAFGGFRYIYIRARLIPPLLVLNPRGTFGLLPIPAHSFALLPPPLFI